MNVRTLLESLIIAFSTYSRIPMPKVEWNDDNMKYSICFFPLIGFAVGGLMWIWGALSSALGLGTILRAAVLTLVPVLVTGGIHLDGLLDTADAQSSCKSREERLRIMKDSHTGAFAVIWCFSYFLIYFGVMSEMEVRQPSRMGQLMLVFVISRACSAMALLKFPKAKNTGLLRTFSDKAMNDRGARIMGIVLAAAMAVMTGLSPKRGLLASAAGGLGFWLYYKLTKKTYGGITGDLAGCFLCLEELFMCAALLAF